jgi:hypothetical protein
VHWASDNRTKTVVESIESGLFGRMVVRFEKITKKGNFKTKKIFTLCVAAVARSSAAATATAKDDVDVRQFIQKLYTFSLANFELAKFDSHLKLKRHCALLKLFFAEYLVKQPQH